MPRIVLRSSLIAAALVASLTLMIGQADARKPGTCRPYEYGNPDLFYNHYVSPVCGGVGARYRHSGDATAGRADRRCRGALG